MPDCACGKPLKAFASSGKFRKYCGEQHVCIDCGADVLVPQAKRCRDCWAIDHTRRDVVCKGCGVAFHPKGTVRTYCSKRCAGRPINVGQFSVVRFNTCKQCGKRWVGKRFKVICSDKCKAEIESIRYEAMNHAPTSNKCKECGSTFKTSRGTYGRARLFCCGKCKRKYHGRVVRKKFGNKYRDRARKAGVDYQPVNRLKVFDRDGWRCQICGKPTPRNRQGTHYSNAPELDHRVPLAQKGPHTYANVQCACRACNHMKSNSLIVGQLPLLSMG